MANLDDQALAYEILGSVINWKSNQYRAIRSYEAGVLAGADPAVMAPAMNAQARLALGILRQVFNFYQTNDSDFIAALQAQNLTPASVKASMLLYRDSMRIYRDAPKTTLTEITLALNALKTAIPEGKSYLHNTNMPGDW